MSELNKRYDERLRSAVLAASERDTVEVVRRLVRDMATEAGLERASLRIEEGQIVGQFRQSRMWNCIAMVGPEQLAALQVVRVRASKASQPALVALTDELLGRALDASIAAAPGRLRPWLGYVLVLEQSDFWIEHPDADSLEQLPQPDESASRARRIGLFVDRVVAARLLDAACVVVVDRVRAAVTPTVPSLSFEALAASFAGRCLSFATVSSPP